MGISLAQRLCAWVYDSIKDGLLTSLGFLFTHYHVFSLAWDFEGLQIAENQYHREEKYRKYCRYTSTWVNVLKGPVASRSTMISTTAA